MKRKVDVTLLGRRFTVKTERDETYVHTLAMQVSRRLDDVRRQVRGASIEEQALLVAMGLADELSEERERGAAARKELRARAEAVVRKLQAALSAGATSNGDGADEDAHDAEEELVLSSSRQV